MRCKVAKAYLHNVIGVGDVTKVPSVFIKVKQMKQLRRRWTMVDF